MIQPGTPLPWVPGGERRYAISSSTGRVVLLFESEGMDPEDIANAEFIVTACNAFPDLVSAARRLKLWYGEAFDKITFYGNQKQEFDRMMKDLEAALAKAGGAS